MAFLFKSKKHQNEKAAAANKADSLNSSTVGGSQSSLPGAGLNPGAGRGSKEHKDPGVSQTPTPTSSVNNSINSFHGNAPSPDHQVGHVRRQQGSGEMSDLPVSLPISRWSQRAGLQQTPRPNANSSCSCATLIHQSCKLHTQDRTRPYTRGPSAS